MSHFLVIDDDPIILKLCKTYFAAKGHQVTTAIDGRDGIQKFEKGDYDLVITDLMMPYQHGYEVIDKIKLSSRGAQMPIILLTADRNEPDLEKYERHRFEDDALTKPFDMYQLEKIIGDVLDEVANR
jgi:two-component system response regulator VanR